MSIIVVILVLNVVFLDNTLSDHEVVHWIRSPRITKWGTWGSPEICPNNSWVGGMKLKIDRSQGWSSDATALNAIELHCLKIDWIHSELIISATGSALITSAIGPWGDYELRPKYCPRGFATGYQLRSDKKEAISDDVAAVDFKLKCTNFDGTTSYVKSEFPLPWGSWSAEQNCPSETAVCGIKTQVEAYQGIGLKDDTSLNNVDLACCKVPHPAETCKLETKCETVAVCPQAKKQCRNYLTTSIVEDSKLSEFEKFYGRLGFVVDFVLVQRKLQLNAKKHETYLINGKSMERIISETKIHKRKVPIEFNCEGMIQQLVVICGPYKVFSNEYRCVPNGDQGRYYNGGLFFQPNSLIENILWSYNCDFSGGNITTKKSRSEDCGDLCLNEKQCTHFTWTTALGGICWMKGTGVSLTPTEKYDEGLVCGWIERTSK